MKLYIDTKKLNFEEEDNLIEHEIILNVSDKKFYGYDISVNLKNDDKFIKDTLKIEYKRNEEGKKTDEIDYKGFVIKEQETWNSFPLYEIVDEEIIPFDYSRYAYFVNTDRRVVLAFKINDLYNYSSEAKVLRKTFKYIMDTLDIGYPDFFKKYNDKIEEIINKNPK